MSSTAPTSRDSLRMLCAKPLLALELSTDVRACRGRLGDNVCNAQQVSTNLRYDSGRGPIARKNLLLASNERGAARVGYSARRQQTRRG